MLPTWRAAMMFLPCPGRVEARGSMVGGRPIGLGEELAGLAGLLADRHAAGERVRSACALARTALGADGCAVYHTPEGDPFTLLGADGVVGLPASDGQQASPPPPWFLSLPLGSAEATLVVAFNSAPADKAAMRTRGEAMADLLAFALTGDSVILQLVERAKREWEATVDTIAEGVAILDSELTVVRANRAFASLMGSTPKEIVGRKAESLAYGAVLTGRDGSADWAGREQAHACHEVQLGERYLSVTVYQFLNDRQGRLGFVHVLRDVTEERRWQDTVVRTERLRALGEMATGVAHSFGNLLVSIGGWAEVLLTDNEDEAVRRPANAIQQAAQDGAEAVRRLQNYARSQHGAPYELVDANAVARDALELSQPRWRPLSLRRKINFAVSVELQPVPPVMGNAAELREVLLNLIFNAIDAMPAGGRLVVSTSEQNGEVRIAVRDSGTGIPEDVRKRIFDPFFTTKGQSGSGLGLAIAAGVVERHGGRFEVESQPGEGSAFTVILPAYTEAGA